jgi:ligand-binding SRPBCC domain-containing protein
VAVFTRRTRVHAPLEEVWAFHANADGLVALTPGFANLRIECIEGPDGDPDPDELVEGSRVHVSVRPFGVLPRQSWTSRIVERERDADEVWFRDVMEDGPFGTWEHTHRFVAVGDGTVVEDRVEFEFPGGRLGRLVSPLGCLGLEPAFRHRHRKTRELLE